jgi:SRSO17 transposase
MASVSSQKKKVSLKDPRRWGLSTRLVKGLGEQLYKFYQRFKECFKTKTRDTSEYAYNYMSAQLRMEVDRNFANIGRATGVPEENIQHFMSNSPWLAQTVYDKVQAEISSTSGLENGVLVLDESSDEKSGEHSAGAGRQYNGRLGKVEISQVGVFLAYATDSVWTWIEGELFLPEHWFRKGMAKLRRKLKIPRERKFETKPQIGLRMIKRVKANGLLFSAVLCDTLYGRSDDFRAELNKDEIYYMADIPENIGVYLEEPIDSDTSPAVKVRDIAKRNDTHFQRVKIRNTERGVLNDLFACRRVWTFRDKKPTLEWLVIRKEENGDISYALSNKPSDTSLRDLAYLKCQRWFIERANQDAKSEIGFDEFQAQTYRAFEHHLALTVLSSWFVAQTKFEWSQTCSKDPLLKKQLKVDALPGFSMANICTLLKAVMPLPQLTQKEAQDLVVKHLLNRTRSRRSRINSKTKANAP